MSKEVNEIEDIRLIDLSDVEDQKSGKVFVLNTTSGKERGDVILVVGRAGGDGGADTVVIPATWIPIELTTLCHLQQLVASNNLRTTVSRGQLRLLNATDCEEFLRNSKDAQAEMRRLRRYESVSNLGTASTIGDLEVTTNRESGESSAETNITGAVSSFVQLLEVAVKELSDKGEKPDDDFNTEWLNKYRSLGDLTLAEYKYVHRKTSGVYPAVAALARKAGKKLENE